MKKYFKESITNEKLNENILIELYQVKNIKVSEK